MTLKCGVLTSDTLTPNDGDDYTHKLQAASHWKLFRGQEQPLDEILGRTVAAGG